MSHRKNRVAIVFPADALAAAGADVVSAPYADEIAQEIEARLAGLDVAVAWFNPVERGARSVCLVLRSAHGWAFDSMPH